MYDCQCDYHLLILFIYFVCHYSNPYFFVIYQFFIKRVSYVCYAPCILVSCTLCVCAYRAGILTSVYILYIYFYKQQQESFSCLLSGTTWMSRYQKKHLPTHHPDHHPVFISFHLL